MKIAAVMIAALILCTAPAIGADYSSRSSGPEGVYERPYSDPLAPFNEKMFSFNLQLNNHVLRPVAIGYARIIPKSARRSVSRFFDNVSFIPRPARVVRSVAVPGSFHDS